MPPVDRDALKGAAQSASSGQQAASSPPQQKSPSMADVAQGAMAGAAAAAMKGQPASASAAPGEGESRKPRSIQERLEAIKAASEDRFPIRWRSEDVELSVDEAQRLAQIGMSAQNLQQQRADLQKDKATYNGYQAWMRWLQENPDKAAHIQAVYEGRVDPNAQQRQSQNGDDDLDAAWGQTQERRGPDPAMESRLARLEQMLQRQNAVLNETSFEKSLEQALDRNKFASANPDNRDYVRDKVSLAMAAQTYDTLDEAVAVESNRLQRIVERELEGSRKQREQQAQDFSTVAPASGRMALQMPDAEGIPPTARGLRNSKDKIREWMASMQRAVSSG